MAKPKRILSESEKNLIIALYEIGKTDDEVSRILHIQRKTFIGMLKYNNLTSIIKEHKGLADSKVELSHYQQCLAGNVTAIIHWECNRMPMKWKNSQRIDSNITGIMPIKFVIEDTKEYKPEPTTKEINTSDTGIQADRPIH